MRLFLFVTASIACAACVSATGTSTSTGGGSSSGAVFVDGGSGSDGGHATRDAGSIAMDAGPCTINHRVPSLGGATPCGTVNSRVCGGPVESTGVISDTCTWDVVDGGGIAVVDHVESSCDTSDRRLYVLRAGRAVEQYRQFNDFDGRATLSTATCSPPGPSCIPSNFRSCLVCTDAGVLCVDQR